MPQIRDYTFNLTTSTTGKTVIVDTPDYVAGDLLLAVLSSDTGTPTWTSPGWTQIFTENNGAGIAMMWIIATAGLPETYTFTASTAETLNGSIISIQDVHATTPIGNRLSVNITSSSQAFPVVTTTANNSLVIHALATSNLSVIPCAIEGPVTQLFAKDGTAHADMVSWSFVPTAGSSYNNVIASVVGTSYTARAVTIAINPPATGATIIPPYCANDLSEYIDPIQGTTAFRGNTALAGTATTSFTGTIDAKTVANATVTARADNGLNTYRKAGGWNASLTATSLNGCRLALSAGNVLTTAAGKNILCHVKPYLPIDMQTIKGIGAGNGIHLGMYSTNGNFKVWHVHGGGTSWGENRAPVVVNTLNTLGIIQSTGTLNENSIAGFGFFGNGFVTASDWTAVMLWLLDTTTVSGGNAAYPIGVDGIRQAASDGHERMSVIQQGSSQMLVLQPLQFGNGGTNPIYLDLDSTATEFPQQYNRAKKSVFYCGGDNVAGLTYYAGASDTIIHSNAVVSSLSPFHWRIHASSSALATYNFSGLAIIGAGDVQLRAVTTFNNMNFASCSNIAQNSAVIINCSFSKSTLTANNPSNISDCSFTKDGGSYAIIITTPGTYSLNNVDFSGYGANGTANAAIYNNSGGLVTLNISGGGSTPTVTNGVSASTTIVASANVTLTGLIAGSEIRAYLGTDPSTSTEIGGIESSTTSFSFSQSYSGQAGYIQVFSLGYQPIRLPITYSGSDVSIPIQQSIDRVFINPV